MSGDHSHAPRTAIVVAVVANSVLLVVQVVVGLSLGSLSLLADSLHNASDVVALLVALAGAALAARPATARRTYGLARAEVLAALLNGSVLLALTAWVVVEAVSRLGHPSQVDPVPLGLVGMLGLAVNAGSAWYLARRGGSSLNVRAAFWHLAADALGSLGVVVAAGVIWSTGAEWADPVASLLISVLVVVGVVQLLRETVGVLLEQVPAGIDPTEVAGTLEEVDRVESVHHLHVWAIDSEHTALTAHLVLADGTDLHGAQTAADSARTLLRERYGIDHATLEPECYDCGAVDHGGS